MNETRIESVLEKLKSLKMKTAAENLARILQQAEKQNMSPLMVVEALTDLRQYPK
ncbi:MAG: hypothetical protein KBA28_12485 [Syntrophaceae bacterium]|jgi:hypothetical protein|nr:hypothetical protein [Syntrophaceae bacterium]